MLKLGVILVLVGLFATGVLAGSSHKTAGRCHHRHHSRYTPTEVLAFCTRMGSQCTLEDECDTAVNFFKGNCGEEKSCCLPKRVACVELKKGLCTTAADCETREGYHLSDINCDDVTKCCRPNRRHHHGGRHRGHGQTDPPQ